MGRRTVAVLGLLMTMVAQSAGGFAGLVSLGFTIGNMLALCCSCASLPAVRVRLLSVEVLGTDFTNVTYCESRSPGELLGRDIGGHRLFSLSCLALGGDVLASHRAEHRKCSMHGWDRGIHLAGIRGTGLVSSKMVLGLRLDTQSTWLSRSFESADEL
jgi:hypothetical protein